MKKISAIEKHPRIKKMDEITSEPAVELNLSTLIYPVFKTRSSVEPKSLINLTLNIDQVGLLNPVLVREIQGNKYEIISGVKRVMAFQQLGKEKIPAFICKDIDDTQALILSLSDNLNRDDLNVFDQIYSFLHLMSLNLHKTEEEVKAILYRIDNFDHGKTPDLNADDQMAEKVIEGILAKFGRIKIATFILKMRIMAVHPLLIEAVREKGMHYTFALELNRVKDEAKMKELLNQVFDQGLTLKELRDKVQTLLGTTNKPNPFVIIYKKAKDFYHLPEEQQQSIQQKIKEIEDLMAAQPKKSH